MKLEYWYWYFRCCDPTLEISSEDAEDELSSDELSSDEELVTDETDTNDPDIQQIMRGIQKCHIIIVCLEYCTP